jgi:tripartite-type tricarboxylate transporter receptor subunit TctC
MRLISTFTFLVVSLMCFTTDALAQEYPAKPVHLVIPLAAGTATDFVGRTVGDELSRMWGKPMVFENLAGAGGTVGAREAAKAPARRIHSTCICRLRGEPGALLQTALRPR